MNIIIRIIDKVRLEVRSREVLYIGRCESKINRQFITTNTFSYWSFKINRRVVMWFYVCINITPILPYFLFFSTCSGQTLLDTASILAFLHLTLLLVDTQFCTVSSGIFNNYYLIGWCRYLKTVFIFYQHNFTFETSNDSTTSRA